MILFSILIACVADDTQTSEIETVTETLTETVTETEEICATLKDRQVCNFNAIDESGQEIWFHDLIGKPMILDISAMWCAPCQRAGQEVQEVQDIYPDLTYLTLLIENLERLPPTGEDLVTWKVNLGIDDAPVWGGSRNLITNDPISLEDKFFLSGWPTFYLLDEELRVLEYQRGFDSDVLEVWAESVTE